MSPVYPTSEHACLNKDYVFTLYLICLEDCHQLHVFTRINENLKLVLSVLSAKIKQNPNIHYCKSVTLLHCNFWGYSVLMLIVCSLVCTSIILPRRLERLPPTESKAGALFRIGCNQQCWLKTLFKCKV